MQYEKISQCDINIFYKPARILIAGFSGSGKSTFDVILLRKYRSAFNKVFVLGADLENARDLNIQRNDEFNPFIEKLEGSNLMIFDDCLHDKKLIELASMLFTKGRHLGISCIFITQNLFLNHKSFRHISLNSTHVAILRNRDDRQITCFAKTFLPDSKIKQLLDLYKREVAKQKHKYILIDFTADVDTRLLIRNSLFGEHPYQKAYLLQ